MIDRALRFRETFVWKLLLRVQEAIIVVCAIVAVLALCMEVFLRYFLKTELFSYEEIVTIVTIWLYFVGSSYAMYKKSHITADMTSLVFKEKGQKIITLIVDLVSAVVSVVMTVWTYKFIVWAAKKNAVTAGLKIPILYSQSALLVGYLLLSFYCIIYLFEDTVFFIRWMKQKRRVLSR